MKIFEKSAKQIKCLVFTNSKEKNEIEVEQYSNMMDEIKYHIKSKN